MLGDTKNKGGGTIPIWIDYRQAGLTLTFQSKDWNDTENPLVIVTIYKPGTIEEGVEEEAEETCSLCTKKLTE